MNSYRDFTAACPIFRATARRPSGFSLWRVLLILILVSCCLVPASANAQVSASIKGVVTDSSGGAIPGVTVTVKNLETGATRSGVTDDAGRYLVVALHVGEYEVRVGKSGFRDAIRSGIVLVVGQEASVDLQLQVGQVTSELTVPSGAAPIVSTSTKDISGLVSEQAVKDLPLNGRSYDLLLPLNPGIVNFTSQKTGGTGISNSSTANNFSVSGNRPQQNLFLLNGVEYTGAAENNMQPGGASGELLGVEAVREFNVQRDKSRSGIRQTARRPGDHRHPVRQQPVARFGFRVAEQPPGRGQRTRRHGRAPRPHGRRHGRHGQRDPGSGGRNPLRRELRGHGIHRFEHARERDLHDGEREPVRQGLDHSRKWKRRNLDHAFNRNGPGNDRELPDGRKRGIRTDSDSGAITTVSNSVASGNSSAGFLAEIGGELNIRLRRGQQSIGHQKRLLRVPRPGSASTVTDNVTGLVHNSSGALVFARKQHRRGQHDERSLHLHLHGEVRMAPAEGPIRRSASRTRTHRLFATSAFVLLAAAPARAVSNRIFLSTNGNNGSDCANPSTHSDIHRRSWRTGCAQRASEIGGSEIARTGPVRRGPCPIVDECNRPGPDPPRAIPRLPMMRRSFPARSRISRGSISSRIPGGLVLTGSH